MKGGLGIIWTFGWVLGLWLSGCEADTVRIPGEESLVELRLFKPQAHDPFAGVDQLRLSLVLPNQEQLTSTVPASSQEAVLVGPRASGVYLVVEGLDTDGMVVSRGRSNGFDLNPEQAAQVPVLFTRLGEYVRLGDMNQGRFGHSVTALPDGRVLVFGGASSGEALVPTGFAGPEMFDPLSGQACSFGQGGCPAIDWSGRRMDHSATLTAQGTVFLFGGLGPNGLVDNVLLFDPSIDSLRLVRPDASACVCARVQHAAARVHRHTGVPDTSLLPTDSVLISGGLVDGPSGREPTRSSLIFDSANEVFVGCEVQMVQARAGHTLTATVEGQAELLAIGGRGAEDWLSSAELFDGQDFVNLQAEGEGVRAFLETARQDHVTVPLDNRRLMVVGGQDEDGALDSVEIYWHDPEISRGFYSPQMHTPVAGHVGRVSPLLAALSNSAFIVAGGRGGDADSRQGLEQVERLEIDQDFTQVIFSTMEGPPDTLAHAAIAPYGGGVLFFGGLRDDQGVTLASSAVWYYNPR